MRHLEAGKTMAKPLQRLHIARAPKPPRMALPNGATGRELILCGAGPSLGAHWEEYLGPHGIRAPKTDVWATNSALTWLLERGAYVTHGFGIDQTEGLLTEWASAPDVTYCLGSSVNPKLVRHLLRHQRRIVWFHNFVGSVGEGKLYRTIWPTSVMVGDGLNSVNRAMCLAQFMNYRRVTILGCDCAMAGDVLHVNGDGAEAHGATSVVMDCDEPLGGQFWRTKPDMLFSAVAIAKLAYRSDRFRLVGNILPAALIREAETRGFGPQEFFAWLDKEVASLESMKGVPHPSGQVGAPAQPKGRTMASSLFTVRPGNPSDDRHRPVEASCMAA